jgi:apolipoprotein D and lipocalin family protein
MFTRLLVFWCLLVSVPCMAKKPPVTTVNTLSIPAFSGVWYEVARTPNIFQNRCASDSVEYYTSLPEGRMGVRNTCKDAKGKTHEVFGEAWVPNPQQPGQLKVSFTRWFGKNWFPGDYWVLGVDTNRFAVVGNAQRRYGWILSRTPQLQPQDQQAALAILKKNGYDLCRFNQDPPAVPQRETHAFCSGQ